MQCRAVRDYESSNKQDPGTPTAVRFVADDAIVRGAINAGYGIGNKYVDSTGVFLEANVRDLQDDSKYGRWSYGLYLASGDGLSIGGYLEPVVSVGYRPQEDITYTYPDTGKTITWGISPMDITNFVFTIGVKVPISKLFVD
jgi:hypothetical protein